MTFDTEDVFRRLNELIAVDREAVAAFDSAIARIKDRGLRSVLDAFKRDHVRHIDALVLEVRNLGGRPREKPEQLTLGLKQWSARGDLSALRAVQDEVERTHAAYSDAVRRSWPERLIELVAMNLSNVRRHLAFISRAIEEQLWEADASGAAS